MTDAEIGPGADIDDGATVGYPYSEDAGPAVIDEGARIRAGTIVYGDTEIGASFVTGHDGLVREHTTIGDDAALGTKTVIDGTSEIGSNVSFQTGVYVPTHTTIGSQVFIGPRAVLTNDMHPVRVEYDPAGPVLEDHVTIGANATVLPEITVGEGSFVAAGAIVTEDVPPETLAIGTPATHRPLPEELQGGNDL
ncbi:N-acetyltransferase [Halobacteriales archaeon QS_3_64_16]|nr:MAG: N-acetyltransferase [Halobacteriales archaeon QS_3_64_16]